MIRKIRLASKFVTSQPGLQTVTILILPNISQSKASQTMKFGQLTQYNRISVFFKNYAKHEAGRLVPDLFIF